MSRIFNILKWLEKGCADRDPSGEYSRIIAIFSWKEVTVSDPVVIVGGGLVGSLRVLHLAVQGQKFSIIEKMDEILFQVNLISRYRLIFCSFTF